MTDDGIPSISPADLNTRLESGDEIVLVDVREPFERDIADLPDHGQLRIPVAELPGRVGEIPQEAEVVLYCRSGGRSGWATQYLISQGYQGVLNMSGGVLGWRAEVDPTLEEY